MKIHNKSINELQKDGDPIIVVTIPEIAEAITYACRDLGIKISGYCDNETRKLNKTFCGLKVYHTPELPKYFPKARLLIAYHNLDESSQQLQKLGYDQFYSPLELLKNFNVDSYEYLVSKSYMKTKIDVTSDIHQAYFDATKVFLKFRCSNNN